MRSLLLCLVSLLVAVGCTTTPLRSVGKTTPMQCLTSPLASTIPKEGWYRNPFLPDACFYLYRQAEDFFAISKAKLFNDAHVHEVFVDKIITYRNNQPQAWLLYYPKRKRYHGIVLVDTKSSAFTTYRDLTKKFPLLLKYHQQFAYFHELVHLSPPLTYSKTPDSTQESIADIVAITMLSNVIRLNEAQREQLTNEVLAFRTLSVELGYAMPERINVETLKALTLTLPAAKENADYNKLITAMLYNAINVDLK